MGIEFVKNSSSSQFYHRPSGSSDHSWKMVLRSHFHCWTFEHYSAVSFSWIWWIWSPTDQRGPTDQWQSNLLANIHKHTDHFRNIFTSRHFWFLKFLDTTGWNSTCTNYSNNIEERKIPCGGERHFHSKDKYIFSCWGKLIKWGEEGRGGGGRWGKTASAKRNPSLIWAPINPTIRLPQQ